MRDPNRIAEVMTLMYDLWKRHPDMRFGQLLWMIGYLDWDKSSMESFRFMVTDPFYVEDEILIAKLKKHMGGKQMT